MKVQVLNSDCNFDEKDLVSPIIHFKGFGTNINFNNDKIKNLELKCIDLLYNLLSINGGSLIWDGDSFKNDSFTFIIPKLFNKCKNINKQLLFLAFIKEKDIKRFTKSWNNKLKFNQKCNDKIKFKLKPLSKIDNFIDLGVEALNITKSKIIICFGGGYVVNHEYQTILKNNYNPMFYVFDVFRFNKKTQKIEYPSLKSFMYFDKNKNENKQNNNIGYFDLNINEWSINCLDPISFYHKINKNQLKQKQEEKCDDDDHEN